MKKKQPKVVIKAREQTADDIVPFWSILPRWEALSYEDKLRYYWEHKYEAGGRRILPGDLNDD